MLPEPPPPAVASARNAVAGPVPVAATPIPVQRLVKKKGDAPMFLLKNRRAHVMQETDTEDDSASEDLEVIETQENIKYEESVRRGLLSRLGFRQCLWRSKVGSYCVIMTYIMSYDVVTSLNYRMTEYGTTFLLLFALCMLTTGFPLMYLELALGQYISSNVYTVFSRMAPAFGGIGLLALFLNSFYLIADQRSITFFAKFFFDAANIFSSDHAWQKCNGAFNNIYCRHDRHNCDDVWKQQMEESAYNDYIEKDGISLGESCVPQTYLQKIAHRPPGDSDMHNISLTSHFDYVLYNFELDTLVQHQYITHLSIFYLIMILTAIAVAVKHSQKIMVKISASIQLLAAGLCISLVVIMVFKHPPKYAFMHAFHGDHKPSPNETFSFWYWRMFVEAFILTLKATKVGQGGLFYLGSQNQFHNNFIWDSFSLTLLMTVVPILYASLHSLITDSFFLEMVKGDANHFSIMIAGAIEKSKAYQSSAELLLIAFLTTGLQVYDEYESIIICVFSLIWLLNAICNKVIRCEILISTIMEIFPAINTTEYRSLVVNAVMYTAGILIMAFFSTYGFDINVDWQLSITPIAVIQCILLQLVVIGVCYGPHRLFANVTFMINTETSEGAGSLTTKVLNTALMIMWFIIIPIIALLVLAYKVFNAPITVNHWYMNVLYLMLTCIIVPIYLINQVVKQYSNQVSLGRLFTAHPELWGPRATTDRKRAEALERQIRSLW